MLTRSIVVVLLAFASVPTHSAEPSDDLRSRVEALEKLVQQQAAVIEQLQRSQVATVAATPAVAPAVAPAEVTPAPAAVKETPPKVALSNGRVSISSADGSSSVALRGRIFADVAYYNQDSPGSLATDPRRGSVGGAGNRETFAAQDLSSGLNFRRATIGIDGKFARDWSYRFLYDFGGSGTEGPARINEAWLNYGGWSFASLQVGAFSPPANLEDSTSVEDSLFLERATPAELSRALAAGEGRYAIGMRHVNDRWLAAAHITGAVVNDAEIYDEQLAFVGRAAGLVATSDDYNAHLGANLSYVFEAPDTLGENQSGVRNAIRLRDRPELRVDSTRLIDTGPIDADSAYSYGLEAAGNWRNFFVQAERFWYGVDRRAGVVGGDPSFGAWYVQGSWVLTGERRRYNMATASWQQPRPAKPFTRGEGMGAFELAARFSSTDLDWNVGDTLGLAPQGGIRGGEQQIFTLGLNWYPNNLVKFMLDYMRVDVDRANPAAVGNATPFGASPLTPPAGVNVGQTMDVISGSVRVAF